MRILIVTPAARYSLQGNRITANRWRRLLCDLGHQVTVKESYRSEPADCLIALHAKKSAQSVRRFHRDHSTRPILLAVTGTDLYPRLNASESALQALDVADRIIVLQECSQRELPAAYQRKTHVIPQSAVAPRHRREPRSTVFEVLVCGHLRPVKDPFRAARAARLLPASSRIRIVHLGEALSETMRLRAQREMATNDRYQWRGGLPREETQRILSRSRVLAVTSKLEGGANVVSEALAADVPIVSTEIAGSIGILGLDYPGYFPVGDTNALADLLLACECDENFYAVLRTAARKRKSFVEPNAERLRWKLLLESLPG